MSRVWKRKVVPGKREHVPRFHQNLWQYRVGQLTSGNVKTTHSANVGSSGTIPVHSDLQPHALHKFSGEGNWSVCVAVPKASPHALNILECKKVSFMCGHTDPQIFHWFKQLGAVPPRSLLSGPAEVLANHLLDDLWTTTFVNHPFIQRKGDANQRKRPENEGHIEAQKREKDESMVFRSEAPDRRAKPAVQKHNSDRPEKNHDVPQCIATSDTFAVFRIKPEVQLYGDYTGNMLRVWNPTLPDMDPLARFAPRFLKTLNLFRPKLIPALNTHYDLKLVNTFIYGVDQGGLWGMGTQDQFHVEKGGGEQWSEYRFEFGKNQVIQTEADLEHWTTRLLQRGVVNRRGHIDERSEAGDPGVTPFRR